MKLRSIVLTSLLGASLLSMSGCDTDINLQLFFRWIKMIKRDTGLVIVLRNLPLMKVELGFFF